jgi:T-complex protein 1 subunit alpha
MLANDIGHVTITNIETTILKLLQVEDPAAKVLCELADLQNKLEMNYFNGTVAAELLKNADELVKQKIHPCRSLVAIDLPARKQYAISVKTYLLIQMNLEEID